jgi:DNA-directed RNA polymerase subunit M/transcription elongation factor TFIIS
MKIINENTPSLVQISEHVEKIKMFLNDEMIHYEEEYDVELPPLDDSLEETIKAIKNTNTEHILYDFLILLKYCKSTGTSSSNQIDSIEQSHTQNSGNAVKEGEHFDSECPYCKSKEVTLSDQEYDHPDTYTEEFYCDSCDCRWLMIYDMTMDFDFYELLD